MGAGTGLLTRALLADPLWSSSISELKCSEPVEGMRKVFTQTIEDSRVAISDETFELQSSVPDAWADVILAGTVSYTYAFSSCWKSDICSIPGVPLVQ